MIGQILGERYEVQQQLGKQPGRQTILARDLQTQELVVIKLLFLGSDFEWQDFKLFEREAETLKALSHPAIPRYLDFLNLDLPNNKGFALVQSYVEGKSLEAHLKTGRTFSEAEVKQLAKSLLEILIYLHGQQPAIIHRDIKPSNILLTNRSGNSVGQVYLVDFGSVQNQAAKLGGTITVVGTYGYMPPEQFGGRTVPASDLYSLGATLIYLVTGKHPTELPQKDFRIQFQPAVNLEDTLVDWLEWMTESSLDKRLSSANEALKELENPQLKNKARLAVHKPPNSEAILNKNSERIEIVFPAKGLTFASIGLAACLIPLLLYWIAGTLNQNSILLGIVIAIFGLGLAIKILLDLFGTKKLRIDSQHIYYINDCFGLEWNRSNEADRKDISKLELRSAGNFQLEGNYLTVSHHPVKHWLTIYARKYKYEINNTLLSRAELNWLAHELSNWLGLPISNIRKN
jgi:serine/threonine protein kinase